MLQFKGIIKSATVRVLQYNRKNKSATGECYIITKIYNDQMQLANKIFKLMSISQSIIIKNYFSKTIYLIEMLINC